MLLKKNKTYDYIRETIVLEKGMRKAWKQKLIAFLLLSMLCSGTALVSVTLMGITLALVLVVLVGMVAVLFAISRFKK
jgi:NhaP-type Na+/H+ and K+/H+ antiporter